MASTIYILTSNAQGFQFLWNFINLPIFSFFDDSHPNSYEVTSHYYFYIFFGETSIQVFDILKIGLFVFVEL